MPIEEYVVGAPVTYNATFYADPEKTVPVDPTTVTLIVQPPTEDEFTLSGDANAPGAEDDGVFSAAHVITEAGDWNYRWETTDPMVVVQGVFHVRDRNV